MLIAAGLGIVFVAGGASVTRWVRRPVPEPVAVAPAPVPEELPPTSLPLRLLGTRVEAEPGRSVAILADAGQDDPQLVHEGEALALWGGARLVRIEPDQVVLDVGGRLEALRLTPDPAAGPAGLVTDVAAPARTAPQASGADPGP